MPERHEPTGERWQPLADPFPAQERGGRRADHRAIIDGVPWRLRAGAPGRDLPERYGTWQTARHRLNDMRRTGLIRRLLGRLRARPNARGPIDAALWRIAGAAVRAARAAAGAVGLAPEK